MKKNVITICALFMVIMGLNAQDYIEFTDESMIYNQDFNELESTEGAKNIVWTNGVAPLIGWYAANLMQDEYPQDVTVYSTGGITATAANGLVSYGSDSDRALGSRIANATGDMAYGVKIKNSTSASITSLQITYTGEQWTYANACPQVVSFAYKLNADVKDAGFTEVAELQFSSPVFEEGVTTTNRIDGNASVNRVEGIIHTINVNIPIGELIFLRWLDINDPASTECPAGVDHGLAIDDLTVVATLQSDIDQILERDIKLIVDMDDNVVVKGEKLLKNIAIYNALGGLILNQSVRSFEVNIPAQHLSGGVYFAKITLNNGLESIIRFIK